MAGDERLVSKFTEPDRFAGFDSLTEYLTYASQIPAIRSARAEAICELSLSTGQRVIDLGCGLGETTAEIGRMVGPDGEAFGLDLSLGFLEKAIQLHGGSSVVHFLRGDVCRLPFEGNTFSRVYVERVFQHLESPEHAIREAHRVLAPGGVAVFLEPDWGTLAVDQPDVETTEAMLAALHNAIRNPWIGRQLARMSEEAGFAVSKLQIVPWLATDFVEGAAIIRFDRVSEFALNRGMSASEVGGWLDRLPRGRFVACMNLFIATVRK